MLAKSLEVTPCKAFKKDCFKTLLTILVAMMSRPVAGVRKGTVIVTLPGSPKGAKENLEAIIKLLPHACLQAGGMDSRSLHSGGVKKLEQEAGVSSKPVPSHDHSHNHHSHGHTHGHAVPRAHTKPEDRPQSNDPSAGPTNRYRESPYPMISVEEAIRTVLDHTPSPGMITTAVYEACLGSILAHDVYATEAVPAFRASIVDGYAVIAGQDAPSTKGVFPVVSISHAAPGKSTSLKSGQIARITTGAPLPEGATSVVMVEDTVVRSTTEDGKEEKEVEILTDAIEPGENVREPGSDIKKGEILLRRGERLTTGALGLLVSVGIGEVAVFQRPFIGVMSTGDEIVDSTDGPLQFGQVRDCNRPSLLHALELSRFSAIDAGIASDK
jgi:gephyrin